jgi:hypothetical protein
VRLELGGGREVAFNFLADEQQVNVGGSAELADLADGALDVGGERRGAIDLALDDHFLAVVGAQDFLDAADDDAAVGDVRSLAEPVGAVGGEADRLAGGGEIARRAVAELEDHPTKGDERAEHGCADEDVSAVRRHGHAARLVGAPATRAGCAREGRKLVFAGAPRCKPPHRA